MTTEAESGITKEVMGIKVPKFFAENGMAAFNFLVHPEQPPVPSAATMRNNTKSNSTTTNTKKKNTTIITSEKVQPPTTNVPPTKVSVPTLLPPSLSSSPSNRVKKEEIEESKMDPSATEQRLLSVICPTDHPIIELPKDGRLHHFRNSIGNGSGGSGSGSGSNSNSNSNKLQHPHQQPQLLSETDWELLSDRASACSVGGSGSVSFVVSARGGGGGGGGGQASVISFNSSNLVEHGDTTSSSNGNVGGNGNVGVGGNMISGLPSFSLPTMFNKPQLKRTASSSTIDSQDNVLGPSGKGILGVDYVEHIVVPTDTLQGICISYRVSASNVRRANHFTGHSLQMAPKKLLIPLSKEALQIGFIREKETDSKEYQLNIFCNQYPDINYTEAKAYLELANWDLKDALQSAKEDREWETNQFDPNNEDGTGAASGRGSNDHEKEMLKSGQISIHVNVQGDGRPMRLTMKGTGHNKSYDEDETKDEDSSSVSAPTRTTPNTNTETISHQEAEEAIAADAAAAAAANVATANKPKRKTKVIIYSKPPAIATNSVIAQDVYNASLEDQSFGLELKPITKKKNLSSSSSSSDN